MPAYKKYIGVTFMSRVAGANKWRAQIVRQGLILSLGSYPDPDSAGAAYDNASHHLANWSEHAPQFNFPRLDDAKPEPTPTTLAALAKLKERFPNWEREHTANAALTEFQRVERDAMIAVENTILNMNRVRTGLSWAFGQLKMQEVQLAQYKEQVAGQARVIAGLRATGGHNPFRPVTPIAEAAGQPARPAEIVLPPPINSEVADHLN